MLLAYYLLVIITLLNGDQRTSYSKPFDTLKQCNTQLMIANIFGYPIEKFKDRTLSCVTKEQLDGIISKK